MVKIVTNKAWGSKEVRILGVIVEAYETYKNEIFYNVNITTYPSDSKLDMYLHPIMGIVEHLTELRQALDIRNTLRDIDEKYRDSDNLEVILTVKVNENSFHIEENIKSI